MKTTRSLAVLALALGAAAILAAANPLAAQGSGVYTAAQAQQGAKLYDENCSACHAANLSGGAGPPLAGRTFMLKWTGQTADDLHDLVSTQMPLTAPGSLKPAEYLALVAFILSKNGYPDGTTPLDKSKLKSITIKPR